MHTRAIVSDSLGGTEAERGGERSYLRAIRGLFGFEFLYVSFLMIHFFKRTEKFMPIQREIDLTAALFGLLILGWGAIALQRGYKKNKFSSFLLPPLVLLGWLLISLLYSRDPYNGFGKVITYLPTTAAAFLVGYFVIAPDDRRVRNFFIWMILFACFLSYINIGSYYIDEGVDKYWAAADRKRWSSYIDRSMAIVSASAVLFCLLFDRSFLGHVYAKFFGNKYICILLLSLFFWAILHGGARQGFALFGGVPIVVYFLFNITRRLHQRIYFSFMLILVSLCLFLFFYYVVGDVAETSIYRRLIKDVEVYGFSRVRLKIWTFCWELIKEMPWKGVGFGGFKEAGGQEFGYFDYPHNLFLEVWVELGMLGMLILFVWIALFCKGGLTVLRKGQDSLFIPTFILVIVWFLSLQVSGSWVDSRFTAAFLGIFSGRIVIASSRNRLANSKNRALKAAKGRRWNGK